MKLQPSQFNVSPSTEVLTGNNDHADNACYAFDSFNRLADAFFVPAFNRVAKAGGGGIR